MHRAIRAPAAPVEWDLVPRLGGAGGSGVDVADPRDLRSADGAETRDLVAPGRLEVRRRDQRTDRAEQAALNVSPGVEADRSRGICFTFRRLVSSRWVGEGGGAARVRGRHVVAADRPAAR